MSSAQGFHATITEALSSLSPQQGDIYQRLYEHGTLQIGMYSPQHTDPQQPHTRDEVYVVASGSGWFVNGDQRHAFSTGDVLFVAAGVVHRFEDFTEDFSAWVIFYGPEGGESPIE